VISISRINDTANPSGNGLRPINLRTDLAKLADLIELVFADTMDSGGRAVLQEMRYLSRMGVGLNILSRMNEMAMGFSLGYVWEEAGQLVGNVSISPARWPSELGQAWIIANVGVHPDYQRRGIARRLMVASLASIRERGGKYAILQVDDGNEAALNLYHALGFVTERTWINWRRNSSSRFIPPPMEATSYIRHRRRQEWKDEYALAERIRPFERGGLGWERPLHVQYFRKSIWQRINDWLNLRGREHLVIFDDDDKKLLASLWIDNNFGSKTRFTLLVEPTLQGTYDDMLLNTAVRRYSRTSLVIEHPADELATGQVLSRYHFIRQRQSVHMRLTL